MGPNLLGLNHAMAHLHGHTYRAIILWLKVPDRQNPESSGSGSRTQHLSSFFQTSNRKCKFFFPPYRLRCRYAKHSFAADSPTLSRHAQLSPQEVRSTQAAIPVRKLHKLHKSLKCFAPKHHTHDQPLKSVPCLLHCANTNSMP